MCRSTPTTRPTRLAYHPRGFAGDARRHASAFRRPLRRRRCSGARARPRALRIRRARRRSARRRRARRGAGRAVLRALHLGHDRPPQGRRGRPSLASAISSASPRRATASAPATASIRACRSPSISRSRNCGFRWSPARRWSRTPRRRACSARSSPSFWKRASVTCLCCVPTLLASIERDLPKLRGAADRRRGLPAGAGQALEPAGPRSAQQLRPDRGDRHGDARRA